MSMKNEGGPAFPQFIPLGTYWSDDSSPNGMTLRDYFAVHALQGMLARPNSSPTGHPKTVEGYTAAAYEAADAMLNHRLVGRSGGDPLDTPLPCNIEVGGSTFRMGVRLGTFVEAARHWHQEAFPDGYNLTPEQKAANLQALRDLVKPGSLAGRLGVAVDLLAECLDPLEVSDAVIEDEDGNAAIRDLIERVRSFVTAYRGERAAIKAAKGEA